MVIMIVFGSSALMSHPVGEVSATQIVAPIKHVWVIVEENHDWSDIKGNETLPYINSLLAVGASADNYHNVPAETSLHPSEPNYIVMEAGDHLGLVTDDPPSDENSFDSPDHLVSFLTRDGYDWRSYQEGISGTICPLEPEGDYAPKHNPMIYFQDVTDGNNPASATCIAHVRPVEELTTDLTSGNVAAYNFLTPDLCNDMHNKGCEAQADAWLGVVVPQIMQSAAYQEGGVIFITWDEGGRGNEPIGKIVLSPYAKARYANTIEYTHASMLRTVQEIFGLEPWLGAAAKATDLSDLFLPGTLGP